MGEDQLALRTNDRWLPEEKGPTTNEKGPTTNTDFGWVIPATGERTEQIQEAPLTQRIFGFLRASMSQNSTHGISGNLSESLGAASTSSLPSGSQSVSQVENLQSTVAEFGADADGRAAVHPCFALMHVRHNLAPT